MRFSEACECLGIPFAAATDPVLTDAVLDSRKAGEGSLFVCVRGERADGHDYAGAAVANGACALLCTRRPRGAAVPCLVVADVIKALGLLARAWRDKCAARVICVTGTAGKTTLKETLVSIFEAAGKHIAFTKKNYNNQLGLPCAILAANGEEDFWILEAGISHAGDMDELGAIARPDLAVILNAGPGHCQGLGEKGTAWHKARLLAHLRPGGEALVSADYPELVAQCRRHAVAVSYFGVPCRAGLEYCADARDLAEGEFALCLHGESLLVKTQFRGAYGAETAIAAAACADLCGIEPDSIIRGLAQARLPEGRGQSFECGRWRIFDDTYNANPLSMQKMLAAAAHSASSAQLPLYVVLGEMGELGEESAKWHRLLGRELAQIAPAAIFWKGGFFAEVKAGYASGGGSAPVLNISDTGSFLKSWRSCATLPGAVIFKGSRANHMEELLAALKNDLNGGGGVL